MPKYTPFTENPEFSQQVKNKTLTNLDVTGEYIYFDNIEIKITKDSKWDIKIKCGEQILSYSNNLDFKSAKTITIHLDSPTICKHRLINKIK